MSQKKSVTKQRNEKGQFVKGNSVGKDTQFDKDNAAACKFKEEYCDMLLAFFNKPATRVVYKEKFWKGELTERIPVIVPEEYPTFELFAASIGVSTGTLKNWCKQSRRFEDCYARAKEMQLGKLTTNAVTGLYNPVYAKFEAVNNHHQKDKSEVETNVKGAPIDERTMKLIERVEARLNANKEED